MNDMLPDPDEDDADVPPETTEAAEGSTAVAVVPTAEDLAAAPPFPTGAPSAAQLKVWTEQNHRIDRRSRWSFRLVVAAVGILALQAAGFAVWAINSNRGTNRTLTNLASVAKDTNGLVKFAAEVQSPAAQDAAKERTKLVVSSIRSGVKCDGSQTTQQLVDALVKAKVIERIDVVGLACATPGPPVTTGG